MPTTTAVTATPPFAFVGGDPALDLVNTADWPEGGLVAERLSDYSAVLTWAVAAGVLPPPLGERLRRQAATRPREAHAALARTRHVRGLLRALFRGGADAPAALRELNPLIGDALGRLRLAPAGRSTSRLRWEWDDVERRLDAPLWPVLRAAAELLVSDEVERIRTCDGADCGWMYVDRSRNGLRRWCQMRTCGTVEKTRRRRQGETH